MKNFDIFGGFQSIFVVWIILEVIAFFVGHIKVLLL